MSDSINDTDLIRQMRSGDKNAFAMLYRRHHAAVYRYALLRCGSVASAADVVQEVFIGLMSDAYRYDALKGELRYFLFGVARNVALKFDAIDRKYLSATPSQSGDDDALD